MRTPRGTFVFVTGFLLSGQTPGHLLAERRVDDARAVLEYIRSGPPLELAMTDPALFARLRKAITRLVLNGWY